MPIINIMERKDSGMGAIISVVFGLLFVLFLLIFPLLIILPMALITVYVIDWYQARRLGGRIIGIREWEDMVRKTKDDKYAETKIRWNET